MNRMTIYEQIAAELKVAVKQVQTTAELLDGGATVPFVARYRKEATGGLDDIQLRELAYRLEYLRELSTRRAAVLQSIDSQGKLTPELRAAIEFAATKQELEDLYLPYKPKRRTKGMMAREGGLEPLADKLFGNPLLVPLDEAAAFVLPAAQVEGADFSTPQACLDGARDILSERWAETPELIQAMREWLWGEGVLVSLLADGKDANLPDNAKFRDYFDYREPLARVPSHRALAVFRARGLEILNIKLAQPVEPEPGQPSLAEGRIANLLGWGHQARAADDWLRKCVNWTWRVKLSLSLERELFARLREAAEATAIKVFADNLRDLLLAAPAGPKAVMGLDPGIRTGVKVAVVDATGKLLETATVFPHEPRKDWDGSIHTLQLLAEKHGVQLIAIGNGTASRETDQLAADLIKRLNANASARSEPTTHSVRAELVEAFANPSTSSGRTGLVGIQKVVVSEAGASVYSASEFASQEMPDVDVSLRGAASIARRLQDPLAELVKIDPKSIGVGQYQHDVNQSELAKTLEAVVEDCVNGVGVDLNTASVPLLSRVSGLSNSTARAVVRWREANGAFQTRKQLLDVSGLGPKAFEQSAGFLRIQGGSNPLDASGVHPETYPVVEKILEKIGKPIGEVMGRADMLKTLRPELFANEKFGIITVADILTELEKPGRDPRGSFVVARFNEDARDIKDLKEGMVLEGTVSNVAAFGAFVDLGVHQDGLVHVSQLSHKFVTDAREVVKTGQVVKVRVVEVDVARKRIALTMKLDAAPTRRDDPRENKFEAGRGAGRGSSNAPQRAPQSTAMGDAFAKLQGLRK
jgi:protein Tex